MVVYLEVILKEDEADLRYAAVTALEQIEDEGVIVILKHQLINEEDNEINDYINEILENVEG